MNECENSPADAARTADIASISILLSSAQEEVLQALIENPNLDETHVLSLLKRNDLPGTLLEAIAKKGPWQANYRVRLALVAHPHTPRLAATRLLRDLHLMDLVRISLLTTATAELRRLAEDRILAQLPQIPLGQRLMLAKRGPGRVAAGIIAEGPAAAAKSALDNSFLTEAQLLKALAKDSISEQVISAIVRHTKWSLLQNVRIALIRHKHASMDCLVTFLPDISQRTIVDLLNLSDFPTGKREFLRKELIRREGK